MKILKIIIILLTKLINTLLMKIMALPMKLKKIKLIMRKEKKKK